MSDSFADRVYDVVRSLEPGEVVTYGEVAEQAGRPGAARAVGRLMAGSENLPWWRVIAASGRLVPGLEVEHQARLEREGIDVVNGKVVGQRAMPSP